jgi:hypothetical protein
MPVGGAITMTRTLRAAVLTGLLCGVGACASPLGPADTQLTPLAGSTDAAGDIRGEATWVVRDAETFARLWVQFFGRQREVPAVDFSRHMVVVATMGQQPTAGYAIEITGMSASRGGELAVHVRTTSPGANCGVATVLTTPVVMSRARRTDGPVRFDFTRSTRDCAGR